MKKISIVLLWWFITILLSSCNSEVIQKNNKYYSTGTVFSGSITSSHSYIWYVEWESTIQVAAKVWWKITKLNVDSWDFVKKWDLLAELDSSEAKVWMATSDKIVWSLFEMKNTTAAMFDEQIAYMQEKINQAEIWKTGTQSWYLNTLSITKTQLDNALLWIDTVKSELEHTKNVMLTQQEHILSNSKDAIVVSVILDTNIINFLDELLGVTDKNEHKNDKFEDYLSVKDKTYIQDALAKFKTTHVLYTDYKSFYDTSIDGNTPSRDELMTWLQQAELLAESLKSLLDSTYHVLDHSIDNVVFPSSAILEYKNNIVNFGYAVENNLLSVSWEYLLWIKGAIQNIEEFENAYQMQIELLEKKLQSAEKNYSQIQAVSNWNITDISTQLSLSESQLNEAKLSLQWLLEQKEAKLSEIDVKIQEAQWQKNSSSVMAYNWKVYASVSGLITDRYVEVWQVVWWWIPLFTLWEVGNVKVQISINDDFKQQLSLWESVLLEIDGLQKQVVWKVYKIYPSKDRVTKKIYVDILVENNSGEISIWSYSKVLFSKKSKANQLIIPNDAIVSQYLVAWVYVLDEGVVRFKNIEIIDQNDNFSHISGLEQWDIIIIDGKENVWDTEEL